MEIASLLIVKIISPTIAIGEPSAIVQQRIQDSVDDVSFPVTCNCMELN